MRLLTWNLNHRAARHHIPTWVEHAISAVAPDAIVLTEYVEGPDHERFIAALAAMGLEHVSLTERPPRQNQLLVATRLPHARGALVPPDIHPSIPANVLHVRIPATSTEILGVRMPCFTGAEKPLKRVTWEWILGAARELGHGSAMIAGDFNTAPGARPSACGDCLTALESLGWRRAAPLDGCSFRSGKSKTGTAIDHAFLSETLRPRSARYSWDFQSSAPESGTGKVGIPDHAMLIVDCEPAAAAARVG